MTAPIFLPALLIGFIASVAAAFMLGVDAGEDGWLDQIPDLTEYEEGLLNWAREFGRSK